MDITIPRKSSQLFITLLFSSNLKKPFISEILLTLIMFFFQERLKLTKLHRYLNYTGQKVNILTHKGFRSELCEKLLPMKTRNQ